MKKMESSGRFLSRKLADAGSAIYRKLIFPFVKAGIERRCDSIIGKGAYLYKGTRLEGRDYIGDGTQLCNVRVGYSSYIGPGSIVSNTKIGRYTCIAGVETAIGRHPVKGECVSVHPAFYSSAAQYGYTYVKDTTYEEALYTDKENGYNITIGNDVWIGRDVMITDGVTIGDGAVIGARSLVKSNVAPYAIYAGTPAIRIGFRFDEETIEKLLKIRWWDRDEKWIAANAGKFINPGEFVKEFGTDR